MQPGYCEGWGSASGINRAMRTDLAVDALTRPSVPLVTLTGKAGTGKTLLALASAIAAKRDSADICCRPLVPLSNKDMGFCPGDIESRMAPYMQPIWDNLKIIRTSRGQAVSAD